MPSAQLRHIHAFGGVGDDVVGVGFAVGYVGVGHAHHRQMLVALAAAVARAVSALLFGSEVIPHVIHQHAVLDQHIAAGRVAFVVYRVAAPLVGHRAVVYERHQRRSHQLADPPGEDRSVLGDVVGFQAVAASFVEQNAAASFADHHRHRARRGGAGLELGDCSAGGFAGQLFHIVAVEDFKAHRVADGFPAGLHSAVAHSNACDRKRRFHLVVSAVDASAVGHHESAAVVAVAAGNLRDVLVHRAGGRIHACQHFHLAGFFHGFRQNLRRRGIGDALRR